MDPFTLWLLGSVVAPDAYERVVNTLNTKSAEDRLAKRVHEDVGRYPKGVFRRWYRQEETWRALVTGGQESFETLVDRLVATSKARLLGRALRHAEAEKIVRAAVVGFVGSLDASDAVAVADYRSAQRDALIDRNAETRASELRDHFDTRFDSVESHLELAETSTSVSARFRRWCARFLRQLERLWRRSASSTSRRRPSLVRRSYN